MGEGDYQFLVRQFNEARTVLAFKTAYIEFEARKSRLSEPYRKSVASLALKRANNIGGKKFVLKFFGKGIEAEKEGDVI